MGQVSKGLGKIAHQLSDEFIVDVTDEFNERLQHFLHLTNYPQSSLTRQLMCCIEYFNELSFLLVQICLYVNWAHC